MLKNNTEKIVLHFDRKIREKDQHIADLHEELAITQKTLDYAEKRVQELEIEVQQPRAILTFKKPVSKIEATELKRKWEEAIKPDLATVPVGATATIATLRIATAELDAKNAELRDELTITQNTLDYSEKKVKKLEEELSALFEANISRKKRERAAWNRAAQYKQQVEDLEKQHEELGALLAGAAEIVNQEIQLAVVVDGVIGVATPAEVGKTVATALASYKKAGGQLAF